MTREVGRILREIAEGVEPNALVLEADGIFCDLLGLVKEEYVVADLVGDLTKEERYEISKWALIVHVAASWDDPPLPRLPEPPALSKIVLMPGRRVLLEAGHGVIESYDYPPEGGAFDFLKRPKVRLDSGEYMYPTRLEIIGVEELYCTVCGKAQFSSPGGMTCENGHGGAEGTPHKPDTDGRNG